MDCGAPLSTRVRSPDGQAPHHDPRAGRVHRALPGRRELRAARHAGLGRDRAAGARGGGGARLRGRPDRARAGRRGDRGRRPARRQPQRLLEPGARARRPARALRRRAQHAGRRRRRRARARARAGRSGSSTSASTASSSCRSGRPAAAGPRSRGRSRRSRSATRCRAWHRPARWSSTTSSACSRASSTSARSGTAASRCCPGRWRPRPTAKPSAPSRARRRRSGSTAASSPARTRSTAHARSRSSCSRATDRPTAILCMSDSIAYGVYAACAELGLSIPGDVAVAGFGDHPISRLLSPPLTSTVWDVEQVARARDRFLLAGDRRRRPAGDAARGRRAGARRARVDRLSEHGDARRREREVNSPPAAKAAPLRWRGANEPMGGHRRSARKERMSYVDLHLHLLPGVDDGARRRGGEPRPRASAWRAKASTRRPSRRTSATRTSRSTSRRSPSARARCRRALDAGGHRAAAAPRRRDPPARRGRPRAAASSTLIAQGPPGARWVLLEVPFDGIDAGFLEACRHDPRARASAS